MKKRTIITPEIISQANLEEAADEELQAELLLWEATLMDGLEDEEEEKEW